MSPTPVRDTSNNPPENMRSIVTVVQPVRHIETVQTVIVRVPEIVRIEPIIISNEPEISNAATPESKKDFDIEGDSKKDFEKPPEISDELEFDMDADVGRWRTDDQVKQLVVYRHEWGVWPEDVEDKVNNPTGLESYYELRYFKNGTNRKGEQYAIIYSKHRAKRDLWIDELTAEQAIAQVDAATPESNVVPFRKSGTAN